MRTERSGWSRFLPSVRSRQETDNGSKDLWKRSGNFETGKSCGQEGLRAERTGIRAGQEDYGRYRLSGREWLLYLAEGAMFCAATAYVFYRSFTAFLLFLPVGFLYPLAKKKELALQRQEELRRQFKEAVLILSSSLGAGYSVENAFAGSLRELEELYGREGMITKEFSYIAHQLRMNRTVETLLAEFADRSGLEETKIFPISLLFQSGAEVNWYR